MKGKPMISSNPSSPAVPSGPGSGQCIDGLLWIGSSYKFIDCERTENCAIPTGAECFVHEAEWRGISRKVSHVPKWVVPNKTRIFLAHRGGCEMPQEGKIFGYFILTRVEILSTFKNLASSPDIDQKLGSPKPEGEGQLTVTVYDSSTGRQIRGATVQAEQAESAPVKGSEKHGHYQLDLASGECQLKISLQGYRTTSLAGVKVPSGKRRKVDLYLKPQGRMEQKDVGWDLTEIAKDLYKLVDIDNEIFVPHRSCSLRLRPRAVYLVDALCAEITDSFSRELDRTEIGKRYQSAVNEGDREVYVMEGRASFPQVVESVRQNRRSATEIRSTLEGAELRGELVVFRKPVIFERFPRAAFRSLQHIDGEHLLEQISRGDSKVTIRLCASPGKTKSLTRPQIAAWLIGRRPLSQAVVKRFFDALAEEVETAVKAGSDVDLRGIGRLHAHGDGEPISSAVLTASLVVKLKEKDPKGDFKQETAKELLDDLSQLVTEELEEKGVLRLPGLGTLRRKKTGDVFTPIKALGKVELIRA